MKTKAFTLIELLVVLVVIGILATALVIGYGNSKKKSICTRIREDFDSIAKAAESYYDYTGSWAGEVSRGESPAFVPEFLSEWPTADFYKSGYKYDWENWDSIFAISLRPPNGNNMIYYYCVQDDRAPNNDPTNDCQSPARLTITALNRGGTCP